MKQFLTGGPAVADGHRLWEDVEIGFVHTVSDDGVVKLATGGDSQPVPAVRRFPARLTPGDHIRGAKAVHQYLADAGVNFETLEADQQVPVQEDVMVRLVSAVIGTTVLWDIYDDPTVAPEAFNALMEHLLALWDWDRLLADMVGEDQFPFG